MHLTVAHTVIGIVMILTCFILLNSCSYSFESKNEAAHTATEKLTIISREKKNLINFNVFSTIAICNEACSLKLKQGPDIRPESQS